MGLLLLLCKEENLKKTKSDVLYSWKDQAGINSKKSVPKTKKYSLKKHIGINSPGQLVNDIYVVTKSFIARYTSDFTARKRRYFLRLTTSANTVTNHR